MEAEPDVYMQAGVQYNSSNGISGLESGAAAFSTPKKVMVLFLGFASFWDGFVSPNSTISVPAGWPQMKLFIRCAWDCISVGRYVGGVKILGNPFLVYPF